jgi:hypothetical protein
MKEHFMGLDLGTPSGLELDFGTAADDQRQLRESAEAAIQIALRLKSNRISFNTGASLEGRETELANMTAELQKQYPGLKEIVPSRAGDSATAYLNETPGPVKKFLFRLTPPEV